MKEKSPLVGIIFSNNDIGSLVKQVIKDLEFRVACGKLNNFKTRPAEFEVFLRRYNPNALLFEIPIPYAENCRYVKGWLGMKQLPTVILSTNKEQVESYSMKPPIYKVVQIPFDMDELALAVTDSCHPQKEN